MVAHLKILVFIAVISGAVYANSLQNSFHFDDQHYIVGNPYIREISNIPSFFKSSRYSSFEKTFSGHYRPLLVTSYAINFALGGLNPVGYHVVNLIFHIGSAFLVYLIVGVMLGSSEQAAENRQDKTSLALSPSTKLRVNSAKNVPPIDRWGFLTPSVVVSVAAGLIFAVHPFNSEVVNYITARSSVLCSFFYLLSFYCWVKYRQAAVSRKHEAGVTSTSSLPSQGEGKKGGSGSPATYYVASLLAFVLAMLTKEIAVTLPVALFLYDLYFHKRAGQGSACIEPFDQAQGKLREKYPDDPRCHPDPETSSGVSGSKKMLDKEILKQVQNDSGRGAVKRPRNKFGMTDARWFSPYLSYLPYGLLVILPYLVYRLLVFGRVVGTPSRDYYTNLLTQPKVLVKYLQLMFFPSGFTIDHDIVISTLSYDIYVLLGILALLSVLTTAYFLYRKGGEWRVLSFFILWFFITLLPTTIIPLNAILQENRGYLAGIVFPVSIGLCIGKLRAFINSNPGANSGDTILNPQKKLSMVSPEILLLVILSIYSLLTIQRNPVWKNDYTLWSDAVNKAPASARAHDNLGLAYIERGKYELALAEFQKTLELNPRYYLAHYNAGVVYQLQNRLNLARSSYEACIRINPGYFRAYYNLGIVYKKTGDLDKAIDVYEKAISLDPRHPFVYNNLGIALTDKGEIDRAVTVLKKAIEADPRYEKAHFNLGNIYYKSGKYDLAAEAYRSALRIKPDYREAGEMLTATIAKLSK